MNGLIIRLFFVLLLLLSFGCVHSSKEPQTDFSRTVPLQRNAFVVSKEIKERLLHQFPDFEIIKKEEYSSLFWDFYDPTLIPNECSTDINNDQIIDYVLLIKQKNNLKLAIVFSTPKGYSYWVAPFSFESVNAKGVNFCLAIKPAGRTDVVKKVPESLVIKKNGFLIKNLEQDYMVFYEANGEIMTFKML
jgi:hypothetical protein